MLKAYIVEIQKEVPSIRTKMQWKAWFPQKKAYFSLEEAEADFKQYTMDGFHRNDVYWTATFKADNPFNGFGIRIYEVELDAKPS